MYFEAFLCLGTANVEELIEISVIRYVARDPIYAKKSPVGKLSKENQQRFH